MHHAVEEVVQHRIAASSGTLKHPPKHVLTRWPDKPQRMLVNSCFLTHLLNSKRETELPTRQLHVRKLNVTLRFSRFDRGKARKIQHEVHENPASLCLQD
jgi:hypothetical protein